MTVNDSSPQIFEHSYYQRLHDIEEDHWWAMGLRDVMDELFRKALNGSGQLRVLDVGCGTGYLLRHLERYDLDGQVTGLDYSLDALEFCHIRGSSRLVLASATEPPFPPNSFDLIICIDTIQHLSPRGSDRTALETFAQLLGPGGVLYLRTNSALGRISLQGVDPDLYRRYRRPELVAMVEEAGLSVERATYVNFLPSIWGSLRERFLTKATETRAIGPGLAIQVPSSSTLNGLMHGILKTEAYVIGRMGVDLPFGHSLALLARKLQ